MIIIVIAIGLALLHVGVIQGAAVGDVGNAVVLALHNIGAVVEVLEVGFANFNDDTKAVSPQDEEARARTHAAMLNQNFRMAICTGFDRGAQPSKEEEEPAPSFPAGS